MADEGMHERTRAGLPDACGAISSPGRDRLTVRAERRRCETTVVLEGGETNAVHRSPDACWARDFGRQEIPRVGSEERSLWTVTSEPVLLVSACGVPYARSPFLRRSGRNQSP